MPKLVKEKYYSRNGETKIKNYHINISKKIVNEANITENDELKIYVSNNRIIIEKK